MSDENHFVPQFYLRRFSADRRSIRLLNLQRSAVVPKAGTSGQCKQHKLYGFNPNAEGALGELEGATAAIFRQIDGKGDLSTLSQEDSNTLKFFMLMQKVRTAGHGRAANEMTDYFGKLHIQTLPEYHKNPVDLSDLKLEEKFPTALSMQIVAENAKVVSRFDLHLLKNRTGREFITSDNPAVAHNPYCEGVSHRGVTGVGCPGFLLVLPISPVALLLMFDRDIYAAGSTKRSTASEIGNVREIENLNAFQFLNAEHNVYFLSEGFGPTLISQAESLRSKRQIKRLVFVDTKPVARKDGTSSSIVHHFERLLPVHFALDCMRIRRRKRSVPMDERGRPPPEGRQRGREDGQWVRYEVEREELR